MEQTKTKSFIRLHKLILFGWIIHSKLHPTKIWVLSKNSTSTNCLSSKSTKKRLKMRCYLKTTQTTDWPTKPDGRVPMKITHSAGLLDGLKKINTHISSF